MLNAKKVVIAVVLVFMLCYANTVLGNEDKAFVFSADFLASLASHGSQSEPLVALPVDSVDTLQDTKKKQGSSSLSAANMHRAIHACAGIYAVTKIVMLHQSIYNIAPLEGSQNIWLARMQSLLFMPMLPAQILNTGRFVVGSCGIILETLLYKTIAHLVVLCGSGNFVDATEEAALRAAGFAKRFVAHVLP